MPNLSIQTYQNELPIWVVQWCNKFAKEMFEPSFFCSGDWLSSAARFENDIHVITVTEQESGDLIAVLPVIRKRNILGGIDAKILGTRFHPDPIGLVCKKDKLEEAATKIRHHFESDVRWDSLTIDWTTTEECLAWGVEGEKQTVAPYLSIVSGFPEVLGQFRKKKRYNLKASVKKLLEVKGATVTQSLTPDQKQDCFREFFRLHQMRAAERGIESSVEKEDFFEHHSALIEQSDYARLFALTLENRTIAVIYGFEFANRFFYYQIAHDPEFGELSPGKVILHEVIRHYCDLGYKEFNFLQGDEEYKGFWTSEKRQLFRLRLERRNLRVLTFRFLAVVKGHLKRIRKKFRNGH